MNRHIIFNLKCQQHYIWKSKYKTYWMYITSIFKIIIKWIWTSHSLFLLLVLKFKSLVSALAPFTQQVFAEYLVMRHPLSLVLAWLGGRPSWHWSHCSLSLPSTACSAFFWWLCSKLLYTHRRSAHSALCVLRRDQIIVSSLGVELEVGVLKGVLVSSKFVVIRKSNPLHMQNHDPTCAAATETVITTTMIQVKWK